MRNVYNRITDVGHVKPIDNHRVRCAMHACGATFDIIGDLVNAAHEMLLYDAQRFIIEKRYMQAVLSATTAFELFFAHFLQVELIFRPARRDGASADDESLWMNEVADLLRARTERHTFHRMRRLFLRTVVDQVRPATLAEARHYVASIPKQPDEVDPAEITAVTDDGLRNLLLQCRGASIADLRNAIVHKSAYRPTKQEAEEAVQQACEVVFPLTRYFDLATVDYHLNEPLPDP
jgi:hypothetical protein